MLVVFDASPINILIRVGHIDVLSVLFYRVVVPKAVAVEMSHPRTSDIVRNWLASAPPWFEIRSASHIDSSLEVDPGEREVICLALELKADILLVDDLRVRRAAGRLGLALTGTKGVLRWLPIEDW